MRVAVMTGRTHGLGSLALPRLTEAEGLEVIGLVHVTGTPGARRRMARTFRKLRRIGPLGALNGVRMRRWYGADLTEALTLRPVREVAEGLGVPVLPVPAPGAPEARAALEALAPDVCLSLGNGYVPERVFTLPRLGTLNVHHELLPEFRGAQGVVWQLHEGSATTGFTVHAMDRSIDTGAILHREEVPILFRESLGATVTATMAELYRRSAERLPEILDDLERRLEEAGPQGPGRSFTTPSWAAFRRIRRNHDRLAAEAALDGSRRARPGPGQAPPRRRSR